VSQYFPQDTPLIPYPLFRGWFSGYWSGGLGLRDPFYG